MDKVVDEGKGGKFDLVGGDGLKDGGEGVGRDVLHTARGDAHAHRHT